MKRTEYVKMTKSLKAKPGLLKFCIAANKVGPYLYGALFALLLSFMFLASPAGMLRVLVVTAGSFLLIELVSLFLDYPRPYEKFGVEPAIPEDKADGHTLPCKPAYWYTIIGMTFLFVLAFPLNIIGIVLLIGAAGLCAVRVIGGLHFTRDVIAGILLAVLFGCIGFLA